MRASVAVGIGAIAGFVGIVSLSSGAFDHLLPVNRLLGEMICSLLALWVLLTIAQAWSKRP